jgi:hypothetical protein
MELYIKDRDDISYKSELIPPAFLRKQKGGLIRANNLLTLFSVRKLCAHLICPG